MEDEALEVVISDVALQSLNQVYEYGIETFALNAANVFIDELFERIHSLSTHILFTLNVAICRQSPKSTVTSYMAVI